MPRKCLTCKHPHRTEIEMAVVLGIESYRIIADKWSISFASLQRHVRNGHITKELQEKYRTEGLIQREELDEQIKDLQRLLYRFLRKAAEANNVREIVILAREIKGSVELLGKFLGRFPKEPAANFQVNVLQNPMWLAIKEEIFSTLKVFPDAYKAMLETISSGKLTDMQKEMIQIGPEYMDMTPDVKEIVDKEFEG